jgi:outer membrane protein assembly factor BamA
VPRLVRWFLVGLAVLLVAAIVGIGVLQSSERARQRLLAWVSAELEAGAGLTLEVESTRLRLLSGSVELSGVELRDERGQALLAAESVRARIAPLRLLRGQVEVRSLELERPRVDLATLPDRGADPEEVDADSMLDVGRLAISNGEIFGLPLPEAAEGRVTAVTLDSLEIEGSVVEGELDLELSNGRLLVERPELPPLALSVEAALLGPQSGPLDLERFELSGDTLNLGGSGTVGLEEDQPLVLSFDGRAEAGWLASIASSDASDGGSQGEIAARGDVDLRAGTGSVQLETTPLPAELLRPWVDQQTFSRVDAAGTTLSLEGALDFGPGLDPLVGDLRLVWARADTELLVADMRPRAPVADEALRVTVEATALPWLEGERSVSATLTLADWQRPEEALLEGGEVVLGIPDLVRERRELGRLLPTLLSGLTQTLEGELSARAELSGALVSPRLEVAARWQPAPGALLRVRAKGAPLALEGELEAELTRVPLTSLAESESGLLDGELSLSGSPAAWSGDFDLRAEGVAAGDVREASVVAAGTFDPDSIRFSSLRGEWPDHRVEALRSGAVEQAPLTVAATPSGLRLSAAALAVDGVSAELTVEIPAVLLEEVPVLGARPWPGADASERRPRIVWALPASDLGGLLGLEGTKLLAESRGDLLVDLERPALSEGSAELSPLELVTEDAALKLDARASLQLAGGRMRLEASKLAAAGSTGGVVGAAQLREDWSVGDDLATLVTELDLEGRAQLSVDALVEQLAPELPASGAIEVDLQLSGPLDALSGALVATGSEAAWRFGESADLELRAPALRLEVADGAWRMERLEARLGDAPVTGRASGRFTNGRLEVDELSLDLAGLMGRGRASLPFGDDGSEGDDEIRLEWEIPESDWHPLLGRFGLLRPDDTLRAGARGRIVFSPERPAEAEGRIEITAFETLTGGRRARAEGPVVLTLDAGSLTLEPLTLVAEQQRFFLSGSGSLDEAWRPDQSYFDLLDEIRVSGRGTLLTSLLNPLLAGGIADGFLSVELEASGHPRALSGRLDVDGEGASLTYLRPYTTRITEPRLELTFEAGEVARLKGALRLNEGLVEMEGGMSTEGVVDLEARLSGVRYRLDYGLLTLLGGELALIRSSTGAMALSGQVTVEEGVLTRDVDLDLDLLAQLLAPVDLTSTEESPLENVALDLDLSTVEGVRVKNNVADLLVIWDPIRIRGTLAAPVLDGRFTIEPGGRIRAFGQTVRLDRSSIDFPGQPDQPAVLDLSTTSSRDDSSIAALSREDPFAVEEGEEDEESKRLTAAAAGLGAYYGERIASRLSDALGGASISLQPVLIFGEADPGARLTVSQDFSPQFTLAASVDLRNAEAQTYLLDLHGLDGLPGLNAQAFTTDEDSQGAALRQRLRLGGGGSERSSAPRIAKLRLPRVEGVSKRGLKRAVGLRKGDRLESSGRFAAEVEVGEFLRRKGFSDARVDATITERSSGGGGRVELAISVEPGPRSEFVFEGERLAKPLRRLVTSLYRSDYYEEAALEEMIVEARRGLRSLGFLEPSVEISVAPRDPDLPDGDRVVTVSMEGGRRIDLESIVFQPLPADEAALLAARFARPVQRVELGAGLASADRRVEATLGYLGYPHATVERRELSEDGSELRVEVAVGERPRIAAVRMTGVAAAEVDSLLALTGLEQGEALRPDRIARASLLVREELRRYGYADAVVETRVEPATGGGGQSLEVHFDAETGARHWVSEVRFEGMSATRPGWAEAVAELEVEDDFSMDEILEARSRLWQTGLFSAVVPETYRAPAGDVRVGFELRERSRFEVAYGLRWDSDDDASALVEVIDRNALGRGWIAGLRAQLAEDDESVRAFGGLPRLFNPRSSLELFALAREERESGLITETLEGTIQLSYALSRRLTTRLYGQYKDTRVREEVPNDFFPIDVQLLRPLVGTQLLYDSRSGDQLGLRGLLATGDLSFSEEAIGSDFNYARFFGQVNSYRAVGRPIDRPLTWAQSVRVGLAEAFDQELVRQDRFFAGGAFSVRGYATESLGPQEDLVVLVRPLGGEALFVLNEELRWRFHENLTGLWFVDVGNVWETRSDFGSDLATSTGFGLRALTPLGLLRLDLAHALDGREGIDPEFKLYFGFGSTF